MSSLVIRAKPTNADKVWLRISAFLSLKSPATRVTYSGIVAEWCRFLRTEPGTADGAEAILSATDLHAIAYRKFLETKPGEKPRMARMGGKVSSERGITIERTSGRGTKKDGLDATQSNATIHKKFAALRRSTECASQVISDSRRIRSKPIGCPLLPKTPGESALLR